MSFWRSFWSHVGVPGDMYRGTGGTCTRVPGERVPVYLGNVYLVPQSGHSDAEWRVFEGTGGTCTRVPGERVPGRILE